MSLRHVRIILSHPSEPRNVGAVCRAIKNAGMTHLTIVTDSEIDLAAARPLAVSARDVLDQVVVVDDLAAALSGSTLIAGITRRVGQRRKLTTFAPWQLARKAVTIASGERSLRTAGNPGDRSRSAAGMVSIVFGNEQSGLSDTELGLCHMAVAIPSSSMLPSLNLSHAVQVIAYELYVATKLGPGIGGPDDAASSPLRPAPDTLIDSRSLAAEVDRISAALENLGFHTQEGPQGMVALLNDILGRAMLSQTEARRFREMFEKIQGMHGGAG